MTELDLSAFDEDFALFIEAGFIAVKQMDEPSARKLFFAAQTLKPEHPAPSVGLGYIALNRLEVADAVEHFEEVLEKDPEHQLARAFLGIAYLLKKPTREQGRALVKEALETTDDPTVINLCKVTMQWADKDLQDKKAPFFAGPAPEEKTEST